MFFREPQPFFICILVLCFWNSFCGFTEIFGQNEVQNQSELVSQKLFLSILENNIEEILDKKLEILEQKELHALETVENENAALANSSERQVIESFSDLIIRCESAKNDSIAFMQILANVQARVDSKRIQKMILKRFPFESHFTSEAEVSYLKLGIIYLTHYKETHETKRFKKTLGLLRRQLAIKSSFDKPDPSVHKNKRDYTGPISITLDLAEADDLFYHHKVRESIPLYRRALENSFLTKEDFSENSVFRNADLAIGLRLSWALLRIGEYKKSSSYYVQVLRNFSVSPLSSSRASNHESFLAEVKQVGSRIIFETRNKFLVSELATSTNFSTVAADTLAQAISMYASAGLHAPLESMCLEISALATTNYSFSKPLSLCLESFVHASSAYGSVKTNIRTRGQISANSHAKVRGPELGGKREEIAKVLMQNVVTYYSNRSLLAKTLEDTPPILEPQTLKKNAESFAEKVRDDTHMSRASFLVGWVTKYFSGLDKSGHRELDLPTKHTQVDMIRLSSEDLHLVSLQDRLVFLTTIFTFLQRADAHKLALDILASKGFEAQIVPMQLTLWNLRCQALRGVNELNKFSKSLDIEEAKLSQNKLLECVELLVANHPANSVALDSYLSAVSLLHSVPLTSKEMEVKLTMAQKIYHLTVQKNSSSDSQKTQAILIYRDVLEAHTDLKLALLSLSGLYFDLRSRNFSDYLVKNVAQKSKFKLTQYFNSLLELGKGREAAQTLALFSKTHFYDPDSPSIMVKSIEQLRLEGYQEEILSQSKTFKSLWPESSLFRQVCFFESQAYRSLYMYLESFDTLLEVLSHSGPISTGDLKISYKQSVSLAGALGNYEKSLELSREISKKFPADVSMSCQDLGAKIKSLSVLYPQLPEVKKIRELDAALIAIESMAKGRADCAAIYVSSINFFWKSPAPEIVSKILNSIIRYASVNARNPNEAHVSFLEVLAKYLRQLTLEIDITRAVMSRPYLELKLLNNARKIWEKSSPAPRKIKARIAENFWRLLLYLDESDHSLESKAEIKKTKISLRESNFYQPPGLSSQSLESSAEDLSSSTFTQISKQISRESAFQILDEVDLPQSALSLLDEAQLKLSQTGEAR